MEVAVTEDQKKELTGRDGTWDLEACGLVYRAGECCFNTCTYTSDHYHCQVCGIGTAEISQAVAHTRASPACRKDPLVHFSAPSVGMSSDPTNSLYNAIYNGFTTQNSFSASGFSGYSQMDTLWHHSQSMSDKVAICSAQLSPCCSSNGGTYIPVESQLCSPISDLYSKVTAPMRDLVSVPAKSSGSAIDSQAWFAAYNPQQIQKGAYKYSDQNPPPQINFILLDPSDQKQQEIGEPSTSGKDVLKDTYCAYSSQSIPGLLSEDALFSLQLQDEPSKQADLQQTMLLSDINLQGKNIASGEGLVSSPRVESNFTQEHFGHYLSSCSVYPPSIGQDNNHGESAETSNQPSSAASDSDESDIIVEDIGDDLGSQMTESEIFIEDIKCSLLQGVVEEEENQTPRHAEIFRNKRSVEHGRKEPKHAAIEEPKLQSDCPMKSCLNSYNTVLKCVICGKSVSDGNPGSVLVQMSNQMPLTTSSHTPVLTKLNEVVAIEVTDFLDVNGKFMCQSCFNLVDTVDSLESRLVSLKQDIAAMIKTGSKPHVVRHNQCDKMPIDLVDQRPSSITNIHPRAQVATAPNHDVQELLQGTIESCSSIVKPVSIQEQTGHTLMTNDSSERKEYLLLSGRALSLANSIDKVSLSLGQQHPVGLVMNEDHCSRPLTVHVESCNVPKMDQVTTGYYHTHSMGSVPNESLPMSGKVEEQKVEELRPHSAECKMKNCHEIIRLERKMQENHKLNINPSGKFSCELCGEVFTANKFLEDHLSMYSKSDPSLCEICGQLYHNQKQLDEHMLDIHFVYQKHCEICGIRNFHPCMYKAHLSTHSDRKEDCHLQHTSPFVVQNTAPTNIHTKKLVHTCKTCNEIFLTHTNLENHMKTAHVPRRALSKCDQCERTFVKPSDLQAHKRSHSSQKNFQCKICGRQYKSLGNLNHHTKTHEVKKPYTCEICSQGFIRKDFYETHLNAHKEKKPFKCEKCGKDFSSKSYLQVHLKWHLDKIKKVTCPICKKTFSQRLNVHMRSHTGERPHPCEQCPKRFITGSALRKHVKRIHRETSVEGDLSNSGASDHSVSDSDEPKTPPSCPE